MVIKRPSVIFMGTPDFAVPSLEILVQNGFPVKAVVTAPDRPSGRGLKVTPSAVKAAAIKLKIPVLQPVNLKAQDFERELRILGADIFVVVAFRMLPEVIWSMPPNGTINLHASLLPLYRGAAPVNHVIINGEKVTGVTTFLIEKEIDTGKILLQEKTVIGDDETAGELHDRLMNMGATLVLKTLERMSEGAITPYPQAYEGDETKLPPAPKISRDFCRIDWSLPAQKVHDFVRGLSPWPGAWTLLSNNGKEMVVKIVRTSLNTSSEAAGKPGQLSAYHREPVVSTANGNITLIRVKPEGRSEMTGSEFMRGLRNPGEYFFR